MYMRRHNLKSSAPWFGTLFTRTTTRTWSDFQTTSCILSSCFYLYHLLIL